MSRLGKLERRDRILGQLRLSPHVRISELADQFGVSTETVRRDVGSWEHAVKHMFHTLLYGACPGQEITHLTG